MAKVTAVKYFVSVEPWVMGKPDSNYERKVCEEIAKSIKRHIDEVGEVAVVQESQTTCGYCGSLWEENWDHGEPECCGKAQDEFHQSLENQIK